VVDLAPFSKDIKQGGSSPNAFKDTHCHALSIAEAGEKDTVTV